MTYSSLKRLMIGAPFPSSAELHERLDKVRALAVFASDPISSNAYATESIMGVLILMGSSALSMTMPIAIGIGLLIMLVIFSYIQTILHYPGGGGAYTVAKDNLGALPSLFAAGALLTDYVLTVSVSVSAGIRALTSAFPVLFDYRVGLALAAIILLTWVNLRGVRESGTVFALPTYAFVNLTARIRQQEQLAQRNVQQIMALYRLARETATAADLDAVLRTAVEQLQQSFDANVAILLAATGKLAPTPHAASTLLIDEQAFAVAQWAFTHDKPAGRFTDTLPAAAAHFIPLSTPNRVVGVLGLSIRHTQRLTFEQGLQLETFVNQVALVVERQLLDHAARQSALLQESERLHTTLLNSISHELRTPIATIRGITDLLLKPAPHADATTRQALLTDLGDAAQRLNHLVENLLDMSRLDAGRLQIKRDWCVVSDVVGVAVQRWQPCLAHRPLTLDLPPDLPLVQMDFMLIEQVLSNLLHNICNYTPPGSPVEIGAKVADGWLWLTVADRGPGIPPELVERIFDKFYRIPGTATGGTGLGLSICRGLVHAHGGELTASNRSGGGAAFTIQLPATATPPPVKEADIE